jgi:hypothetical protein
MQWGNWSLGGQSTLIGAVEGEQPLGMSGAAAHSDWTRPSALSRGEQGLTGGPARCYSADSTFSIIFKLICIDSIQRLPSLAPKFPNKICMCR